MSDNIGREVPEDKIPTMNTIAAVQAAHQAVFDNPGKWRTVAGPYSSQVARVRASQANAGELWKSLVKPETGKVLCKGWTDPDAEGEKRAYVLAMYDRRA